MSPPVILALSVWRAILTVVLDVWNDTVSAMDRENEGDEGAARHRTIVLTWKDGPCQSVSPVLLFVYKGDVCHLSFPFLFLELPRLSLSKKQSCQFFLRSI